MSLSTYALITADEIKEALSLQGSGMDIQLENIANRVSEMIETYLDRQIVTRGSLTEYHSLENYRSEIRLTQRPILTISTVKEGMWSTAGTWSADQILVANIDYIADNAKGKLIRMMSGNRSAWFVGDDSVQVVYTAGVADTAAVPPAIKDVALSVSCRKFRETQRGSDGAQQITDGMGFVTRFMPSELLRLEQDALAPFAAWTFCSTGRVA